MTAAPSSGLSATAHGRDAPTQPTQDMEHGDATTSNGGSTSDGHDSKGRHYAIGAGFLANTQAGNFGSAISRHFNNILPPHKRYFNNRISRRTLLIIIGVICICLLALIIGLAAGLSHHPEYVSYIPKKLLANCIWQRHCPTSTGWITSHQGRLDLLQSGPWRLWRNARRWRCCCSSLSLDL